MKKIVLNKITIPEVILGTRGDPALHRVYTQIMANINFDGNYYSVNSTENVTDPASKFALESISRDETAIRYHSLAKEWVTDKKIYYVTRDFAEALRRTKSNIPHTFLPKKFNCYMSFPQNYLKIGEDVYDGCFLGLRTPDENSIMNFKKDETPEKILVLGFDSYKKIDCGICSLTHALYKDRVVNYDLKYSNSDERLHPFGKDLDNKEVTNISEYLNLIVNLLCYIHSLKPDIVTVPTHYSTRKQKHLRHPYIKNLTSLKAILINHEYKLHTEYSKVLWSVCGHWRNQPCGEGRKDTRPVWIDEHLSHRDEDLLKKETK